MDGEQESRWAEAQGVRVGEELVPAALRQLEFLAAVDRRRWLYEGPLLHRAIHRYKTCWLPLLHKHTHAAVIDGPLVVPLDCEWIWHCHRLNPVQYIKDCKRLYGRILDNNNVESSIRRKPTHQAAEKLWTEKYPKEPFELELASPCDNSIYANTGVAGGISYNLVSAVKRQSSFFYQVGTPSMHDQRFLEEALARYRGFLYLIKLNQEKGMKLFRVPTYDVDLMWHTHQLHPVTYCNDMLNLLGRVLEHDDTDDDRTEGKKLDTGFSETTEQFENTFGVRYWKAGAMYRGMLPTPVTFAPQIFCGEVDDGFGVNKAENHLAILETTVLELYLQIVDIKNLPAAIPKESVYVWFTKNQPDMFISDGGRLDISTKTGKSIGASFQCEPTGKLILTVLVDQASSGVKKSESLGKALISLQDLVRPDSKLSFEKWFVLKPHGGHASSPPISLRVAASYTVPRRAPQLLNMISVKPFSLKAFLLPPSTKDQKMSCWTRLVYDSDVELIRLQIREHEAKNGMPLTRELVAVSKSSKKPFKLADFKGNKWSLTNSNLSITDELKSSQDGCILELKGANKLIKLYWGRRVEYELKCCSQHAEDDSAVTAVKFSAEHPYGKAVALLDTESEFIMVDEDWFLLPWIAVSFLFLNAFGKDGEKFIKDAMVQKVAISESDTNIAPETVVVGAAVAGAAPAQCGTCGTACRGAVIMSSERADHATCDSKEADTKCGGCGSGCGGGCGGCGGSMVAKSSKVGQANFGPCNMVVASGGNGHAESTGCGSGCGSGCGGDSVVMGSSKTGNTKSGGCGGGGCGGGCSAMVIEGSKAVIAKSGGCGSSCGGSGGCGTMVIEDSKTDHAKSGSCGSGCGGGCGGMVIEGSKTSHAKSGGCGGGCGSGCGGGCGGMVIEGSKTSNTRSGGCGSGCGGGCGGMAIEVSENSHARSGGCGGGCGAGCGGGCGTIFKASTVTGQTNSGGCGAGCGGGCGSMLNGAS